MDDVEAAPVSDGVADGLCVGVEVGAQRSNKGTDVLRAQISD
jgi:hypothetical protein